jgi:hypothetical protein
MRRFAGLACICTAISCLTAACSGGGGESPTAPSPAAPTFQVTGRVADANTRVAISGVTLSAVDGANAGKVATTAADGRYTLGNLVGGNFRLRATHPSYDDTFLDVTLTNSTNIDLIMTPQRAFSSGWTGGSFFVTIDGQRVGHRVNAASVTPSGTVLNGSFGTVEGTAGTFLGQLTGQQFLGSLRVEIALVNPSRRCRGEAVNVTGTATGSNISLNAATIPVDCSGVSATNAVLTLTP